MAELVTMVHEDTGGVSQATEEGFRQVWEPRGWKLADPVAVMAGGILGTSVADLDALQKSDLQVIAATMGLDSDSKNTADDLRKSIRKAAKAATTPATDEAATSTTTKGR